ncbi:uncharacterized protein MONBRDRAFT_38188 [Monosiga brevicollis MX1]|uniref:Peptidase S53 domain-containing protein n=1 Tax=Monosiga brevicollis TaxID=81824 RepID=A9V673_MONBE|nr:uncharacterized protein MONBRDRAFT_38188 [Monosiga brevicollis MX1]EDQ86938.1 predicted protein [Monosiga brevicollis MX1]|eukprot:XP_001748177.1 hypothetical protein [Monosiga brevicollis MX1]
MVLASWLLMVVVAGVGAGAGAGMAEGEAGWLACRPVVLDDADVVLAHTVLVAPEAQRARLRAWHANVSSPGHPQFGQLPGGPNGLGRTDDVWDLLHPGSAVVNHVHSQLQRLHQLTRTNATTDQQLAVDWHPLGNRLRASWTGHQLAQLNESLLSCPTSDPNKPMRLIFAQDQLPPHVRGLDPSQTPTYTHLLVLHADGHQSPPLSPSAPNTATTQRARPARPQRQRARPQQRRDVDDGSDYPLPVWPPGPQLIMLNMDPTSATFGFVLNEVQPNTTFIPEPVFDLPGFNTEPDWIAPANVLSAQVRVQCRHAQPFVLQESNIQSHKGTVQRVRFTNVTVTGGVYLQRANISFVESALLCWRNPLCLGFNLTTCADSEARTNCVATFVDDSGTTDYPISNGKVTYLSNTTAAMVIFTMPADTLQAHQVDPEAPCAMQLELTTDHSDEMRMLVQNMSGPFFSATGVGARLEPVEQVFFGGLDAAALREAFEVDSQAAACHRRNRGGVAVLSASEMYSYDGLYRYLAANNLPLNAVLRTRDVTQTDLNPSFSYPYVLGLHNAAPNDYRTAGDETMLDLAMMAAFAPGAYLDQIVTGMVDINTTVDPLLTTAEVFLATLAMQEDLRPTVLSASYTLTLGDNAVVRHYLDSVAQALALVGVSVVLSSGDDGVYMDGDASSPNDYCGQPSVSPLTAYGLVVGGVQYLPESGDAVACSLETGSSITSSGGFDQFATRPAYQDDPVSTYLEKVAPVDHMQASLAGNRAFPDVAGPAHNIEVYGREHRTLMAGTSASAPMLAGLLVLVNDVLLQQDLPPLGDVTASIYAVARAHPEVFQDVTRGSNRCGSSVCCEHGYPAKPGWDAVTGLGMPRLPLLARYLVEQRNGTFDANTMAACSSCAASACGNAVDAWCVDLDGSDFSTATCMSTTGAGLCASLLPSTTASDVNKSAALCTLDQAIQLAARNRTCASCAPGYVDACCLPCPGPVDNVCFGRGTCAVGQCHCDAGYTGHACEDASPSTSSSSTTPMSSATTTMTSSSTSTTSTSSTSSTQKSETHHSKHIGSRSKGIVLGVLFGGVALGALVSWLVTSRRKTKQISRAGALYDVLLSEDLEQDDADTGAYVPPQDPNLDFSE